ncbi:MAG: hypothetical protein GX213_13255 [Clostridiaceae bacterium]|nr:hypothetical protein [Clostridiaceae bacterium]
MPDYQDLIYPFDLTNLQKSILEDIASEMGINNGKLNIIDLATEIHNKCKNDDRYWDVVIPYGKPYLFAGKTSLCWYKFEYINGEKTVLEIITDRIGFNPLLQKNKDINESNLSTSPQIIGGISLSDNDKKYLLRLVFKSGFRRKFTGLTLQSENIISVANIIVDEEKGFIEIRSNDKAAKKIESYLGGVLKHAIQPLERKNVIAPFGNKIERLADVLNGNLVETVSIPEEILSELNEEQANAIGNILMSIDEYFISGDLTKVEEALQNSRNCLYNEIGDYLSIPFSAIVLAGMNRLGMAANDELRNQPLYTVLQPYLQHQGGFVKFPLAEDGVVNYYTIKIGLRTNTIYFVTPSTEECINYIRSKLLLLE